MWRDNKGEIMAECKWCEREMTDRENTKTCLGNIEVEFPDGEVLPSVPYWIDDVEQDHRCHDCGVVLEGYHHPGCDMERCPRCGGQLIGCGCLSEDD